MTMDIHEILRKLPHRYPIILVDRVLELVPGERVVALKNVTINEPYFAGHFPNHPVMPGDQLRLEVAMGRVKRTVGQFTGRALVDGQVVCETEMLCAIRKGSEAG
jgi:3-hydroxyacyl-[acyl-carrier-protein] dehydratase